MDSKIMLRIASEIKFQPTSVKLNRLLVDFRSYSTICSRDKFGRIVTRRVIKDKSSVQKVKSDKWKVPELPPTSFAAPSKTAPVPNLAELTKTSKTKQQKAKVASHYIFEWVKDNFGVLILNFGSICTLTAFTRSDILELRCLSMTGSISSMIYSVSKKIYFPAMWSAVFALTNAYKVYFIVEERKGKAKTLTLAEEKVYNGIFKYHGVTPRQFEKLIHIAKEIHLQKGDCLVEKGQTLTSVYLVKSGSMDARTSLQRRVTAASTDAYTQGQSGGDSGVWIGELAFLDALAQKDIHHARSNHIQDVRKNAKHPTTDHDIKTPQKVETEVSNVNPKIMSSNPIRKAILSYVATEDTTIYEFEHEKLVALLSTSTDLRSSITRCMTAAVVSKVVNLYMSKVDADKPIWQKFLEDNWRSGISDVDSQSSVRVQVIDGQGLEP